LARRLLILRGNDSSTGRTIASSTKSWLWTGARAVQTNPRNESGGGATKPLFAVAFGLTVACALSAQEKPIEAWWLNATFTPSQTVYESLPANEINRNWVKMSVLNYAALPSDAKSDVDWMHRDGFVFQIDNYFKRKGVVDRELCGVFEDRAGHKGRFLLVLERTVTGPWKVAYLHQQDGEAGFSVFARKATGLYWGTCMQCDEFSRLRVTGGEFHLEGSP
jgi:hypothetical protein